MTKKIGRPRKLLSQLSAGYRKRLKAGKAKGLSRSQSYGHPRQKEISAQIIRTSTPLSPKSSTLIKSYRVAERMRQGESLTHAARMERIGVSTLKRWMNDLGFIKYSSDTKRYLALDTLASLEVYVKPDAIKRLIVDKSTASQLAGYLNTVMKAIKNNDGKLLDKYTRIVVLDVRGHSYRLVTDLDTLIVLERERKRRIVESQKEAGRQHRISERVEIGGNLEFSA
ncbi:hypothetical protein [Nitrosomonas ureae]|uniref:Homeodomain-like domain-containing protein n=1 Tax=Nitrosomonas ureae TaxID=44577 RepID=A0A0S3AKG4_9PROT|nr:hypothetical protein [Nitrosomonas ureae]ALQ51369.1 hypothetical protein ATY38_09165 [Nitrosomonas ureae]ALQ51651.1 hypothetical protein ATY38_10725 [Nitrosomonas ureae]SDU31011.1 hypothetical protein SAMN05216406_1496 [Nitrosomonas ureae]SDU34278.1 hypothetical protein SAMN05216406_1604 [Nitrosomonas ureae]SDU34416.1 hypothetical protein SAMN05216406_1612 [Nitrosomonas ureae]